ncbi:MAG TPA: ATP-binding protein [bacterium]|nr:ATP-binding protein [bacterium]
MESIAAPASDRGLSRSRLSLLALVFLVNLAGGLLIFLYLSVIDVSSLTRMRFIQSWQTLLIIMVPAALALVYCRSYSAPLFEYLKVVVRPGFTPLDETTGGGRIIHLRRRALRLPLLCALASLGGWVVMGMIIIARLWATGRSLAPEEPLNALAASGHAGEVLSEELFQSGANLQRTWNYLALSLKGMGLSLLIGGMVSATLFFVIESMWQKELPWFFPGGRISAVLDRWIIPVRYRLTAIFVLVGTVPLVMIALLSYQRASFMVSQPPEAVLGSLLLLNLFMVMVGVALAILLSIYVAKSVSRPLERLRAAIERVGAGELEVRVPVRANDEIGRVTEGFNDMVSSLAEKNASIHELAQGLELKVRERTRELTEALAEKERTQAQLVQSEKMASLGQLVAGIAHEINNPVGYIYANTDHLERYLGKVREAFARGDQAAFEEAREKMERLLASTSEGAKRTKEIVAGLRTFSRKDPSHKQRIDMKESVETALMLLAHELKRGIVVKRAYGAEPLVRANPGELAQVFMNIIMNSIQAMGDTGTIIIETGRDGDVSSVTIQDTGPGIPPGNLSRLFEPFFTTKEVGKGTGLGLAIAYGIVKAHGGEIRVTSGPGKGAAFEVRLPAADPARK